MKKLFLLVLFISFLALLLPACNRSDAIVAVPAASLTGYQVVDLNGHTIAQVEDVLLAADSGEINYAILGLQRDPFHYGKAAFVDGSEPLTAVPWDCFALDSASEQIQLNTDRATLYAAPLLTEKPTDLEAGWDTNVQAYWETVELMAGIPE